MSEQSVLVVITDGTEELEAVAPIDILRRGGLAVTVASLTDHRKARGANGLLIEADCTLSDAVDEVYDCVMIPGGAGVATFRKSSSLIDFLQGTAHSDRWVAAICAGPLVLDDAGLLEGKKHPCHFSVKEELPKATFDKKVVIDGKVITSQGPGTAVDFGLAILEQLAGKAKADEVAKNICLHA